MSDSILDRLSFRCDNRWRDLTPHAEGRHCFQCDTTVIDISRLTKKEALRKTRGGACVRLRFGAEGAPSFVVPPSSRKLGGLVMATALVSCAPATRAERRAVVTMEAPPVAAARMEPFPAALPEGVAIAALTDLAHYDATLLDMRHEGGPTEEQIARTRAKHRRPVVPTPPHIAGPGYGEFLGMMDPDW